ncbi:hypothetical protein SO802_034358 [Lithocarpus litseifolius]|uniref:Uncharacterized protein n=1 Tax=Lithocarpus litseifolius TaxID=425828 RepID=A0AAW2BGY5_9ROSI
MAVGLNGTSTSHKYGMLGEVTGSNIDGYVSNLENKRMDLFDHGTKGYGEDNVLLASCSGYMHAAMTNQQLIYSGNRMMDETDQAIGGQKRLQLIGELWPRKHGRGWEGAAPESDAARRGVRSPTRLPARRSRV